MPGRLLSVHDPASRAPAVEIRRLNEVLERFPELTGDQTAATHALERAVAAAVGQPAALFMPSGKMAQLVALRIHADRRVGRRVTLAHPSNHLSLWEDSNFSSLHSLEVRSVGDRYRLLATDDIESASSAPDVASVLWELPQRELGGELPSWHDLDEQLTRVRAAGVATHVDGARLWQTGPFFGRPVDQVGAAFDSVYVSLYKDLGAPRGAVLAGPEDFIAHARRWRHRMGGTIDEAWPLALLALDGLHRVPALMPRLVAQARSLAEAIATTTPATTRPAVPHTAMFHVHLPVPADAARTAHETMIRDGGLGLTLRIRTSPDPQRSFFEMTIGEAALTVSPSRVASAVGELIDRASAPTP